MLRTAEGLGVQQVILTGYTPYPASVNDPRLPHVAAKLDRQIAKTALGAEKTQNWVHSDTIDSVLEKLRADGFVICAVEQAPQAIKLPSFSPPEKIVLIVGREVEGVEPEVLTACDRILEIPMFGQKESFNVVQATAMTLYHCTFTPRKA